MNRDGYRSEVAQLKEQIELVCQAMNTFFSGYGVTATHDAINHKYQALGTYQDQLEDLVGEEQALNIVIDTYNQTLR